MIEFTHSIRLDVVCNINVIPLGSIDALAGGKLNPLGRKINAHTNRYVLCDKNSILLPALQCENDIPFDVHTIWCIALCTQSYTIKTI